MHRVVSIPLDITARGQRFGKVVVQTSKNPISVQLTVSQEAVRIFSCE